MDTSWDESKKNVIEESSVIRIRGAHYIMDFDGWFSKTYLFNLYKSNLLAFLMRPTPLMCKLCPASLHNKIEQASQAELEHQEEWS